MMTLYEVIKDRPKNLIPSRFRRRTGRETIHPIDALARSLRQHLLDLLLPWRCPVCGESHTEDEESPLCSECSDRMAKALGARCPTCGRPFPEPDLLNHLPDGFRCGECRLRPPFLDRVHLLFLFQSPLREAIHLFKYSGFWKLGRGVLRDRLPEATRILEGIELVVPVPLAESRLRRRGFNQSVVLAREVARRIGVPMPLDLLIRKKGGRPQVGLPPKERRRNIRGCFRVKEPGPLQQRNILIVDDVLTTGATANECARVLKREGAREVRLLVLAGAFDA